MCINCVRLPFSPKDPQKVGGFFSACLQWAWPFSWLFHFSFQADRCQTGAPDDLTTMDSANGFGEFVAPTFVDFDCVRVYSVLSVMWHCESGETDKGPVDLIDLIGLIGPSPYLRRSQAGSVLEHHLQLSIELMR